MSLRRFIDIVENVPGAGARRPDRLTPRTYHAAHDDVAIYGFGRSPEEAMQAAKDAGLDGTAALTIAPATERLVVAVCEPPVSGEPLLFKAQFEDTGNAVEFHDGLAYIRSDGVVDLRT
jgi:hypothetical protein